MLKDMKLRNKMLGGFILIALISVVVSLMAQRSMRKMAHADQQLYEEATAPMPELANLEVSLYQMLVTSRDFISAEGDTEKTARFENQLTALSLETEKTSRDFEKRHLSPEIRKLLEEYQVSWKAYQVYLAQIVGLAKTGKSKDAWRVLWSDGYNRDVNSGLLAIDKMQALQVEEARRIVEENQALADAATMQMIIAGLCSLGLAIGGGLWLTSAIVQPLKLLAVSLSGSSTELSGVSYEMSSNAEETSVQANMVSASAEQVTRNLQAVSTATEEMTSSIREIARNTHESARVATSAVRAADATNASVSKLEQSSAEIGQVIKVISSIAQQTNLLALNATIEAARAGEAGKGFAVVASEVKELAKKTATATEDISRKIELIQGNTQGAIATIVQISQIITQINDISNTIAGSVEEQAATTNEIARNVDEAVKGSSQVTENIVSVAQAAKGTAVGAADTQRAAEELTRMAVELQGLLGRSKNDGGGEVSSFPSNRRGGSPRSGSHLQESRKNEIKMAS